MSVATSFMYTSTACNAAAHAKTHAASIVAASAYCGPKSGTNSIACTGKYVLKCLLSPDVRQLATASADKTVKLWNLDGFTLERTLTGESPIALQGLAASKLTMAQSAAPCSDM